MTITRVGTNQKYATGWENAFTGKKVKASADKKASPKKAAGKKTAKKKK